MRLFHMLYDEVSLFAPLKGHHVHPFPVSPSSFKVLRNEAIYLRGELL